MKRIMALFFMTFCAFNCLAGDNLSEIEAALAREAKAKPRLMATSPKLLSATGADTYWATGELNVTKGEGSIILKFNVPKAYTLVRSVELTMNAYDVDYPVSDERDLVYFNGTPLGRLRGGNNVWNENPYSISGSLLKSGENTLRIDVDVDNGGWVTRIEWAKLIVNGTSLPSPQNFDATDISNMDPNGIYLSWDKVDGASYYNVYKTVAGESKLIATALNANNYLVVPQQGELSFSGYYTASAANAAGEPLSPTATPDHGSYRDDVEKPQIVGIYPRENPVVSGNVSLFDVYIRNFDRSVYQPSEIEALATRIRPRRGTTTSSIQQRELTQILDNHNNIRYVYDNQNCYKIPILLHFSREDGHGNYQLSFKFKFKKIDGKRSTSDSVPYTCRHEMRVFYDANGFDNTHVRGIKTGTAIKVGSRWKYQDIKISDNLIPKWVKYWRKTQDGSVSSFDGDIVFDPTLKFIKTDMPNGRYTVEGTYGRYVPGLDFVFVGRGNGYNGNDPIAGGNLYGSTCLANTIRHEKGHKECYELKQRLEKLGQWKDYDGDGLSDDQEMNQLPSQVGAHNFTINGIQRRLRFDYQEKDVNGLSSIDSEYAEYGDQEAYVRWLARNEKSSEDDDWARNRPNGLNADSFPQWGIQRNTRNNSSMQSEGTLSHITRSMLMSDGSDNSDPNITWAFPVSNQFSIVETSDFDSRGCIVAGTLRKVIVPEESLLVEIDYQCDVNANVSTSVVLADEDGHSIICAIGIADVTNGCNRIRLPINANLISRINRNGLHISQVSITDNSSEFASLLLSTNMIDNVTGCFSSNDFTQPEVYIESVSEHASYTNGFQIPCIVVAAESKKVTLESRISDVETGDTVASYNIPDLRLDIGTNVINLAFSPTDIFLNGENNACYLSLLSLADENGLELSYSSDVIYSNLLSAAKCPTNHIVHIVSVTNDAPVANNNGLFRGLSFPAVIDCTSSSPEYFIIYGLLYGTNECFVSEVKSLVCLTNGLNEIRLMVQGKDIADSEIDGPYILKSISAFSYTDEYMDCAFDEVVKTDAYLAKNFIGDSIHAVGLPSRNANVDGSVSIAIPVEMNYADTVRMSAMIVDSSGQVVAANELETVITNAGVNILNLSFSCSEIESAAAQFPLFLTNISVTVLGDVQYSRFFDGATLQIDDIHIHYCVDGKFGDDCNDGFSWAFPKKTISSALMSADAHDEIVVAGGSYQPFSSENKRVVIRSLNGASVTIIDGGGETRCANLGSNSSQTNTVLIGFTLRNGLHSMGAGAYGGTLKNCVIKNCKAMQRGGGVYYSVLEDCQLRDNTATQYGGGAFMSTLRRCLVVGNKSTGSYGGGIMDSTAYDCIIQGNEAVTYGGGAGYSRLYNCTVVGNSASRYGGGVYDGTAVNSIIWGNTAAISSNHYRARGVHNCTTPLMSGDGNIDADPQMRGAGFGGFMLSTASPCLNAGLNNGETAFVVSASGVTNATKAIVLDQDFFGNVRTQDGRVDMGAVEGVTNACLVMTKAVGHGSLDVSFELLTPHSSLTVTADESVRPIDRIEISNGRIVRDSKVTLEDITTDVFITAYFKYYDFYVDAENGDDANDGLSWDKAKKTLQAAVDEALDGETIHVAKGVYAPVSTSDKSILIESVAGAAETVIDGGGVARCAYLAANSSSVASQTNTVLSGFTLMNGRSTQGAGAYGGTLRNCVIRDNVADGASSCRGGGTYYGVQHNCRYIGNSATATIVAYGGAAYYGTSYDCSYIDNSASGPTNGLGGAVYYGTHYNCALTNNTASSRGGGAYGGTWHNASVCKNKAQSGGGFYYGTVYDSRIEKNKASGAGGGAYYTSFTDCEIVNNQAEGNGGGAFLTDYTATRCVFVKNRSNSSGGGVYQGTCTDCEISDNIANSNGGGAYNITATRTSFMRNTAASGGGIYNGTYRNCVISENTSTGSGGGAYGGTFYDSVISGNYASGTGGGIYNGTYHRTKISGNRAVSDGGGTYSGTGYNSLLVDNHAVGSGGGNCSGYLYNCTVSANRCGASGGGTHNGYHYNSVIVDNFNPDGENNCHSGSRYYCMCENADNPRFVNPAACDYRLREGSGCVNAGYNSYANGTNDLSMAVRIQGGTVDIGAYEGAVKGYVVTVESVGGGICTHDPHVVTNGGSFSVSAQPGRRAFLHFKTNGIIATTSTSLTLEDISGDVDISAEFVHELFVDGVNGLDGNDGFSWAKAKKTIQAAIDVSIDGDTIWVAGGVYAPIVVKGRTIEIISTEGSERTIIDGGGVSCCAWLGDENFYQFATDTRLSGFTLRHGYINGNGGGVKYGKIDNCVVENCRATGNGGGIDCSSASNCIVRYNSADGTGGGSYVRVWHRFTDCQFVGNTARSNGGGAYLNGNAILRNCRFSGNVSGSGGGALYNGVAYDSVMSSNKAASGGGTYNGTFYRCELNGNTSSGDGGGAYSGTFYDCIVSNNIASGAGGGLIYSTFHRTRVSDNFAAGNGGGVYSGTGYNSIIARNRTDSSGGGSYSGYNYNCTIVGNYCAAWGGGTYSGYQYNTIVWGNRNAYGEYNCEGGGSLNNCYTANPKFVNVREGDYRLRTGSPCLNAGNASYVNGSSDVDGKTRVQDGTVDIGAHEGAVEGFVVDVTANGGAVASCSSSHVENGGTFTVSSVQTERPFVGVYTNGVLASVTLPFTIDNISADIELTIECAHDLYVDGDFGDDSASGLSWDDAKRTIQGAIDASFSGDVIHIADGWYEPFSSSNRDIRIVSENGPENCIVDGEWSQRCATLGSKPSEVQTVIEGLTLYGGYASSGGGCYYGKAIDCIIESCYSTGNGGGTYGTLLEGCLFAENMAKQYGGASYGDRVVAKSCVFIDNYSGNYGGAVRYGNYHYCLFDGNSAASYGGAASEAVLERCVLKNNESYYGGGTYYGTMYNCLYYDNYAPYYGGGAYYGTLYNCTLTRNRAKNQTAGMYYSTAYNTICWGNKLNSGSVSDTSGSSFYNCCHSGSSGNNTVTLDPLFFDPDNDDFRLSMESPCLDAGNNSNISQSTDLLGNARIHNGTVDIGCYEGPVYIWQISAVACGKGRVDASGTSVLDGGSLSFVAVEDGSPFLGFYTNGVFATVEKSFTWENISSDGTLEAWFKQDIYVDSAKIDDSGDGLSWETARKDLAAVVAEASNGANIWVKSGTYAPIVSMNKHLVITAVDGSPSTIIDGGGTTWCCYAYTNNVSISAATNTVLTGFTLRNGNAQQGAGAYGGTLRECVIESCVAERYGGGTYYGVQYDCVYSNNSVVGTSVARGGAAYYGTSYNCIYENNRVHGVSPSDGGAIFGGVRYDCLIKNNVSNTRGGGVAQATCYRCVLTGNSAETGGGSYRGTLRDCLIAENEAVGNGGGSYGSTLIGCTVVKNIAGDAGGVVAGVARNSIIWGNSVTNGVSTNCVSTTLQYSCTDSISGEIGCIIEDPKFVDVENGDYRLLHSSPCIDAGNNSFLAALSTCDIAQKDRVLNRIVDMGCYEGAFSPNAETQSTPKPVPHAWLDSLGILSSFGGDYEAMANAPSPGANGSGKIWPNGSPCYMWQDFVAGTSPTNDAVFTAIIRMDGNTPVITWEPDTPELRATRVYRTYGKKTLMDANWTDITDKDMSEYHFFKVTVDLP